jgi:hypothetical protein
MAPEGRLSFAVDVPKSPANLGGIGLRQLSDRKPEDRRYGRGVRLVAVIRADHVGYVGDRVGKLLQHHQLAVGKKVALRLEPVESEVDRCLSG